MNKPDKEFFWRIKSEKFFKKLLHVQCLTLSDHRNSKDILLDNRVNDKPKIPFPDKSNWLFDITDDLKNLHNISSVQKNAIWDLADTIYCGQTDFFDSEWRGDISVFN